MTPSSFQRPLSGTTIHFFNEATSTLHILGDKDESKVVRIDAMGSVNLPDIHDHRFLDSIKRAAVEHGLIKENEEIALFC